MSEKISIDSVEIKIPKLSKTNKNHLSPEISRLRRLDIEIYHRGGKLSKKSIESLKKTIEEEAKKLLLKDQFLACPHAGIKAKEWVNFHKDEEMVRRRTTIRTEKLEGNKFFVRESKAEEILKEIDDMGELESEESGEEYTDEECSDDDENVDLHRVDENFGRKWMVERNLE